MDFISSVPRHRSRLHPPHIPRQPSVVYSSFHNTPHKIINRDRMLRSSLFPKRIFEDVERRVLRCRRTRPCARSWAARTKAVHRLGRPGSAAGSCRRARRRLHTKHGDGDGVRIHHS